VYQTSSSDDILWNSSYMVVKLQAWASEGFSPGAATVVKFHFTK